MKKTILTLCTALAAAFYAVCALAAIDCLSFDSSDPVRVGRAYKVLALDADGATVQFERIASGYENRVEDFALTNFTYSVVTTNAMTGAAVTNVLTRPHPIPYPPTMTGYWTNAVITAWSVTNRVPVVTALATNTVEAGVYLAPGDTIFATGVTGRALIFVER